MQITIEDISPVEKRVECEFPWSDVAPRLDRAYNRLRNEVSLRGFRPGKAPRPVLERLYRQDVEGDVARELIEGALVQAVSDKQIEPVAAPRVDKVEIKDGQPFRFTARIEVRSHLEPRDYGGVPLSRRAAKATDEEVEKALQSMQRQFTSYQPVEGRETTLADDVLVIEVNGKVGPNKLKNKVVMLDLADEAGGPLPGLGAHLRGVTVGAAPHAVKYTIDAGAAQRELAGLEVSLNVTIKEVRVRKVPALDDEFAKDTGEADTLDALKARLRDRILEQDRRRIKNELTSALITELIKRNPFSIAPALVDRHAGALVDRMKRQLASMGIDPDAARIDERRMRKEFASEAESEARATVILRAIAAKEGIEVSDADLQKRIAEIAAERQENAKRLRAEMESSGYLEALKASILEEKALDMLLSQAKITDEDPAAAGTRSEP